MRDGTVAVPYTLLHTCMPSIHIISYTMRTLPSLRRRHSRCCRRRRRISIPKIEKCQNSLRNTPKTYGIVPRKKREKKIHCVLVNTHVYILSRKNETLDRQTEFFPFELFVFFLFNLI